MRSELLSLFAARIVAPAISFVGGLFLLMHFGALRFAVLATLLQGSLLACVALKRGQDDAILYALVTNREHRRRHQLTTDAAVLALLLGLPLVLSAFSSTRLPGIFALQVLCLGYLVARITIEAMKLQTSGRIWLANIVPSLAVPISAVAGYDVSCFLLPGTVDSVQMRFVTSLAIGFAMTILLCSTLVAARSAHAETDRREPSGASRRDLWLLQIIDVILLSGDLIMLGLLHRTAGLELYIVSTRLAVVSAFVVLAFEQVLATAQRRRWELRRIAWLMPLCMLAIIPLYVITLYVIGLQHNTHYSIGVLGVTMASASVHALFLGRKVRWATTAATSVSTVTRRLSALTAGVIVASIILSIALWTIDTQQIARAIAFAIFGIATRVLMMRWIRSDTSVP